jgi:hypothetical protein
MATPALQELYLPVSSLLTSRSSCYASRTQNHLCSSRLCSRGLSTMSPVKATKPRKMMFAWLNTVGQQYLNPVPGKTNYLSNVDNNRRPQAPKPFPLNDHFVSHPVLSQDLREEIWKRVRRDKQSVRSVSIELGVEMRRVGAAVRLVELERQWIAAVRCLQFSQIITFFMMSKSNRLVFQTLPW